MQKYFLNLATALTPENSEGGLMICGINWGGAEDTDFVWKQDVTGESFFSDQRFNNFPYRDRLVRWLERVGHPVNTAAHEAGPFERSIVQTNWLRSQAPNMHGKDLHDECVRELGNFVFHVERLRPRLLVFTSVQLLETLNSDHCIAAARHHFGAPTPMSLQTRELARNGKPHKRFRVAFQQFERVRVLALPHPTGSKGLSDDYIASFADLIGPVICQYKEERGFAA